MDIKYIHCEDVDILIVYGLNALNKTRDFRFWCFNSTSCYTPVLFAFRYVVDLVSSTVVDECIIYVCNVDVDISVAGLLRNTCCISFSVL